MEITYENVFKYTNMSMHNKQNNDKILYVIMSLIRRKPVSFRVNCFVQFGIDSDTQILNHA